MNTTPEQLACPHCQAVFRTVKTVGVGDSANLKCPQCGHQAALGEFRRTAAFLQMNSQGSGPIPPPIPPPINETPEPEPFVSDGPRPRSGSYLPRRRRGRGVLGKLIHFLDFGFNRYLTPSILKLTWILTIALVVLGFTVELLKTAGAFSSDVADEFTLAFPDFFFGGDDSSRSGNRNEFAESTGRTAAQAAEYIVRLSVRLLASVLFLLWVRVALEAGIVIFQLAGDVKAMRCKAENG